MFRSITCEHVDYDGECSLEVSHLANTIHKLVLVQYIHGLCFPKAAGPENFDLAILLHEFEGLFN